MSMFWLERNHRWDDKTGSCSACPTLSNDVLKVLFRYVSTKFGRAWDSTWPGETLNVTIGPCSRFLNTTATQRYERGHHNLSIAGFNVLFGGDMTVHEQFPVLSQHLPSHAENAIFVADTGPNGAIRPAYERSSQDLSYRV